MLDPNLLIILVIAMVLNYLDLTLGMGYGTILSPILLLFQFSYQEVVVAVLVSGLGTLLIANVVNVLFSNINLNPQQSQLVGLNWIFERTYVAQQLKTRVEPQSQDDLPQKNPFSKFSKETQIILIFSVMGIVSSVMGSILQVYLYTYEFVTLILKFYVFLVFVVMGIMMLQNKPQKTTLSLKKIALFGLIAGTNKSLTGGGFGPVSVSGQMVSGRSGKNAVTSTTLSEFLVSTVSVLTYFLGSHTSEISLVNIPLIIFLFFGSCISVPLAAFSIRKIKHKKFKIYVAGMLFIVGGVYLLKLIFSWLL